MATRTNLHDSSNEQETQTHAGVVTRSQLKATQSTMRRFLTSAAEMETKHQEDEIAVPCTESGLAFVDQHDDALRNVSPTPLTPRQAPPSDDRASHGSLELDATSQGNSLQASPCASAGSPDVDVQSLEQHSESLRPDILANAHNQVPEGRNHAPLEQCNVCPGINGCAQSTCPATHDPGRAFSSGGFHNVALTNGTPTLQNSDDSGADLERQPSHPRWKATFLGRARVHLRNEVLKILVKNLDEKYTWAEIILETFWDTVKFEASKKPGISRGKIIQNVMHALHHIPEASATWAKQQYQDQGSDTPTSNLDKRPKQAATPSQHRTSSHEPRESSSPPKPTQDRSAQESASLSRNSAPTITMAQ